MSYYRFDTLRGAIRFSDYVNHPDDMLPNRCRLFDDFVKAINVHREQSVKPSELICADESMSRWCRLGGDWIDVPTYRAIDRKPRNDRWRRVGSGSTRVLTETEISQIPCYITGSQIDSHDRCRESDLNSEKKNYVKKLSSRVNTSLLDMCIVDAWLLHKGSHGAGSVLSQSKFYESLAEQLIENDCGEIVTRSDGNISSVAPNKVSGIGPHLTVASRKRKIGSNCALQGRCKICKNRTKLKYTCSEWSVPHVSDY